MKMTKFEKIIFSIVAISLIASVPCIQAVVNEYTDIDTYRTDDNSFDFPELPGFEDYENTCYLDTSENNRSIGYNSLIKSLSYQGNEINLAYIELNGKTIWGLCLSNPDSGVYEDEEGNYWVESAFLSPEEIKIGDKCKSQTIHLSETYENYNFIWTLDVSVDGVQYIYDDTYNLLNVDHCTIYCKSTDLKVPYIGSDEEDYLTEVLELYDPLIDDGRLYSYDAGRYLANPSKVGTDLNLMGVSLTELIDYDELTEKVQNILDTQDENSFNVSVVTVMHKNIEAFKAFLNAQESSTIMGIPIEAIVEQSNNINENEILNITDGEVLKEVLGEPPVDNSKDAWWAKFLFITTMIVGTVAMLAVNIATGGMAAVVTGAIVGAAIGATAEIDRQISSGKTFDQLNVVELLIGAAAGLICALPGVGVVGSACVGGLSEIAIGMMDGGNFGEVALAAAMGAILGASIDKITEIIPIHLHKNKIKSTIPDKTKIEINNHTLVKVKANLQSIKNELVNKIAKKKFTTIDGLKEDLLKSAVVYKPVPDSHRFFKFKNVTKIKYNLCNGVAIPDLTDYSVSLNGKKAIGVIKAGDGGCRTTIPDIDLFKKKFGSECISKNKTTGKFYSSQGIELDALNVNFEKKYKKVSITPECNYDQAYESMAKAWKISPEDLKKLKTAAGSKCDDLIKKLCKEYPHLNYKELKKFTKHRLVLHEQVVVENGRLQFVGVLIPETIHKHLGHSGINLLYKMNEAIKKSCSFKDQSGKIVEFSVYNDNPRHIKQIVTEYYSDNRVVQNVLYESGRVKHITVDSSGNYLEKYLYKHRNEQSPNDRMLIGIDDDVFTSISTESKIGYMENYTYEGDLFYF